MAKVEIRAEVTGTIWKVEVTPGQSVQPDDVLLVVESMKMEIPVVTPVAGIVLAIHVSTGELVNDGQLAAVIEA